MTLWTIAHRVFCPWDFLSKNTGVGYHFILQEIFLRDLIKTWVWSLGWGDTLDLPTCVSCIGRQILYNWVTMEDHIRGMITSNSFKIYLSPVKKVLIYTVNRWQTEHSRPSCFFSLSTHRWMSSASNSIWLPGPKLVFLSTQIAAIKLFLELKNSSIRVQTEDKQSTRKASSSVDLCP